MGGHLTESKRRSSHLFDKFCGMKIFIAVALSITHEKLGEYWPASKYGSIIVNTRDGLAAAAPIKESIEVCGFAVNEGTDFLLRQAHHLRARVLLARYYRRVSVLPLMLGKP